MKLYIYILGFVFSSAFIPSMLNTEHDMDWVSMELNEKVMACLAITMMSLIWPISLGIYFGQIVGDIWKKLNWDSKENHHG